MNDLEGTDRGIGGYGSTGTNVVQDKNDTTASSNPDKNNMKVRKDAQKNDMSSKSR